MQIQHCFGPLQILYEGQQHFASLAASATVKMIVDSVSQWGEGEEGGEEEGGTAALFLRGAKVDRVEALSCVCFPASVVSGTGTPASGNVRFQKPDAASQHHTNHCSRSRFLITTTAAVLHTTPHSAISLLFNQQC